MYQCDLMNWYKYSKCMHPTGPSGQGRGWGKGRGGHLPNQLLTSKETAEFIAGAVERADKKEKIKMEKDDFCIKALAQNQRWKG